MRSSACKPQSVLQSTFLLVLSALVLQVLSFAYRIVLSRMLTPEQMGVYGLMMPVYALLSAGTLSGFSVAAVRTTADFVGDGHALRQRASAVLHTTFRLYFIGFCVVTVIFSACSGHIAALLGEPGLRTALLLLLPCLLMTAFENLLKSVFQGLQNVVPSMISECSEQFVRMLSVGMLLYLTRAKDNGRAVAIVVCGMMVSEVASDVILGFFAGDILRLGRAKQPGLSRDILRCAVPVCAGNACGMLLSSISGAVVPAALTAYGMTHAQSLAAYGELSGMLLPLLGLPGAFVYPLTTVMLPRLTEAFASGSMGVSAAGTADAVLGERIGAVRTGSVGGISAEAVGAVLWAGESGGERGDPAAGGGVPHGIYLRGRGVHPERAEKAGDAGGRRDSAGGDGDSASVGGGANRRVIRVRGRILRARGDTGGGAGFSGGEGIETADCA